MTRLRGSAAFRSSRTTFRRSSVRSLPTHCRNKASLPVGGSAQNPMLGFYRKRSHDLVDIGDCPISLHSLSGVIASVKQWMREHAVTPYDEQTRRGFLRHVVVRMNRNGEMLIVLCATSARAARKGRAGFPVRKERAGVQRAAHQREQNGRQRHPRQREPQAVRR